MRALVIFASRYGNTEKIARSVTDGLIESGVQAQCIGWRDVAVDSLKGYDLICLGGPTEAFSATKDVKDFLGRLKATGMTGMYGFAFDTKLDWRITGSAAKFIEKAMIKLGLRILSPYESAIVTTSRGKDGANVTFLEGGEEQRLRQVGKDLGVALQATARPVSV